MTHSSEPGRPPATNGAVHHATVMDVGTERIARVYAEALLRAAQERHQVDEVFEELDSLLREVFGSAPEWELFLTSGAVGRDRKAAIIRSAFEGRASDMFVNFLLVLNDHERLDLLRAIVEAYGELRDEKAGRVPVLVRSAVPLPADQRERLTRELRETFQKEPVIESVVDPELLGGVVVRVGDWVYDQSIRTKLEDIRDQIIARSSYEIQSGRDRFCSPV
jgi:F-type H+-transporting ATPase subunit delta